MTKTIFAILFLATSLFAELQWEKSYSTALEKASKEHKMVMVMLSKEDCDACWYMENIVFKDEKIINEVEKFFIPLYLDTGTSVMPSGINYFGTPTFHFLSADGEKMDRFDGAANIKDFMEILEDASEEGE